MMEEDNVPSIGVNIPLSPLFPDKIFTSPSVEKTIVNASNGTVKNISSDPTGFNKLKAELDKLAIKEGDISIPSATSFKPAEVNFDRYAAHPSFKDLGFYPHMDNEAYYNKNSTIWDDVSRATPQMLTLAGLGLTAGVRSMGNLLSGNPSFDDTELSDEFGNAIAIGQSSRKGLGAWTNNFVLNSAYTVGILGELAVEETLLGLMTPATGGSSAAAGALRLGQAAKQLKSAWRAIDSVDKARDFYRGVKGVGSAVGKTLLPNTVTWAKGINSLDNLKDKATLARGFGDFYRDLRTVNLTLDESNMEGGFAFTEARDQMIERRRKEIGGDLSDTDLEKIDTLSREAGFKTRMANLPLIYATNAITFDNAFRGFGKYLSEVDGIAKAGGKKLVLKSADEISEALAKGGDDALQSVARVESTSFLSDIKSPRKWANLAFKYTKGNMAEGIQEVGQELVQGATVDYYTSIYKDKALRDYYGTVYGDELIAANDLLSTAVKKSASENVFSGQGFDTFLQGFLTGGLIGGGRRITTAIFDKTINKTEAAKKAEMLETFASTINESALSTKDYMDFLNKENLVVQKEAFFEMNKAESVGDRKAMLDAKQQAVRNNAHRLIASGNYKYYKQFLEDLKGLSPEELSKLFNNTTEKGAEKLDELIKTMDGLEKTYNDVENKFGKPFNPTKYNRETQSDLYLAELSNYIGWEEEKKKIIFAKDFAAANAVRMQKITNNFSLTPQLLDTQYGNFSLLFDESKRRLEIDLLEQEIKALEGAEMLSEDQAKNLKDKKNIQKSLEFLQSKIDAIRFNANNKKGRFKGKLNKKEYGQVYGEYLKYMKALGIKDEVAIKNSFEEFVDYYLLSDESTEIANALNTLIDPGQMAARSKRTAEVFKEIFKNRKKIFEEGAKKYIGTIERNQLIVDLAAIGVQPDLDYVLEIDGEQFTEYAAFMQIGRIPTKFVTESGPVLPGTELDKKVKELIQQYQKNTISQPVTDTVGEEQTSGAPDFKKEDFETKPSIVSQEEDGTFKFSSGLLNFLSEVVRKIYKDQASKRAAQDVPEVSFNAWINSKQGSALHDALLTIQENFLSTVDPVQFESLSEEQQEAAFKNWFSSASSTDFIYDTLSSVGLTAKDIITKYKDKGVFNKQTLKQDESLVTTTPPVNGIFVVSRRSNNVTTFSVVDFENNNVLSTQDEEITFSSLQDAVDEQVRFGKKNADYAQSYVFNGTVFTPGEIWNDGKNNYIIKTTADQIKEGGNLKTVNIETGQERIFRSSKLLLPGKLSGEKEPNRTYLLSTDKYNSVHARREKGESREEAQVRLSELLLNTPEEELLSKMKVVIKENPNYDPSKRPYLKIEGKAANPYIVEKSPKYVIEIYYEGQIIGYLDTLQDVEFLNDKGEKLAATGLDIETFSKMSNIAGDTVKNFRAFKANLYSGYLLWKNAESLIKTSDTAEVELTGKQIPELLGRFYVGNSQYEYGDASVNELAFNSLDGGYFVIERRSQKVKGSVSDSVRYITNGYTPEKQKELEEEISKNSSRFAQLGRYVLAVRQPNGKLAFIELKVPSLTDIQMSDVLSSIKDRSKFTRDNKELFVDDRTENNDGFNLDLSSKLFIALPTSGFYVVTSVNETGDVVLTLARDYKKKVVVFEKVISDVNSINSAEDLVNAVNSLIEESNTAKKSNVKIKVTANSLKNPVSQELSVNEILDLNFKTNVSAGIVKSVALRASGAERLPNILEQSAATVAQASANTSDSERKAASKMFSEMSGYDAFLEAAPSTEPVAVGTPVVSTNARADIERRRQEELEFTFGKNIELISSSRLPVIERNILFTPKYPKGANRLNNTEDAEKLVNEYKEINANFDAELARELYKEMKAGKMVTEMTPAEQQVADKYITPELRASVDAELAALEKTKEVLPETKIQDFSFEEKKNRLWKEAYLKAIEEGASKKDAADIADNDPAVKEITDQINDALNSASESLGAWKQEYGFTPEDKKSMGEFLDFVKKNLPDYFVVEQLETLEKNLKTGVITLGKFYASIEALSNNVEIRGNLRVSPVSPFKYHEAFHGLFRLILNEEQISKYLKSAKKEKLALLKKQNKTIAQAIEDLRITNPEFYSKFSAAQMEDLVYEEYLADAFESWKKNKKYPTDVSHKNLFARIIEWIKMMLGLSDRKNIVNLFREFDAGKYANSPVANNRFTKDITNRSADVVAFKQILSRPRIVTEIGPDGKPELKKYTKFFSGSAAIKLIADVTGLVNKRMASEKKSSSEIIDSVIADYRMLYNLNVPEVYDMYLERFGADFNTVREEIKDLEYILSEKREEFKEAILNYIGSSGYIQRQLEEENEEVVDSEGNQSEEERIAKRGGMSGLSSFVKTYLSSITRNTTDQFGNTEFIDGQPMIQSVDIGHVYNGLLNALAGQVSQKNSLERLLAYSKGNPDVEAVVDAFFKDTGITVEDGIISGPTKNFDLYQKILKGFEQFSVNYKFIAFDKIKGASIMYDANRKDRSYVQLSLWKQAFDTRNSQSKKDAAKSLNDLLNLFKDENSSINTSEIDAIIKQIANTSGIHFHPSYIKYSLAAHKVENSSYTPEELSLAEIFSEIQPLTLADIAEIQRNLTDGTDPFVNVFEESSTDQTEEVVETSEKAGSLSRLTKMAAANAFFDETISATSWKNADGETVWNHQYSTYSILATELLKDQIKNNEFEGNSFYDDHLLLSNPKFISSVDELKIERIDGLAIRFFDTNDKDEFVEGSKDLEINREKGKTFGGMQPAEFIAYMLSLGSQYTLGSYIENGISKIFAKNYHIPSILEASSTSNIISLPVVKYFNTKGQLTVEGQNAIFNEIKREFATIQEARKEAAIGVDLIKNFHNGAERGFKFSKMRPYLSSELITHLEEQAQNQDLSFEDALFSYSGYSELKSDKEKKMSFLSEAFTALKNEAEGFINVLVDLKGLYKSENASGSQVLGIPERSFVPANFLNGHGADGIYTGFTADASSKTQNLRQNLYQFYINDLMNSNAWNQLIKGNSNRSVKDAIDEVKRNKGENAGGFSAYTEVVAENLGINHATKEMALFTIKDPVFVAKYMSALKNREEVKEQADAQMWITSKSFRHLKFGFGELDENFAKLLDKVDRGESLTDEEIFGSNGMIERGTMLNSLKVVYYKPTGDGKYIKTSAFVLTKEFTSTKDAYGKFVPLAGYETLHNLREALEEYEKKNSTISALIPESASKMAKQNVSQSVGDLTSKILSQVARPDVLDMRMMYLQQKNPSNKLEITDPSQNKQIINVDISSNVKILFNGKETTVGELSDKYEKLSASRYLLKYKNKRNKVFRLKDSESVNKTSQQDINVDLKELYLYAQETLVASGRAAQAEYFELDELGEPKYDHNNPVVEPVFVEMMLAYLSKGVLQEKVPGHTLTLVSDFGIGVVRRVVGGKSSVVRRNTLKKNSNLNDAALIARNVSEETYDVNNVKGSKEGDVVLDRLRFDVTEYDKNGKATGRKYAEVMLPAHFREIMTLFPDGEIPSAIAEMFGIRIPTQDKHSALFIKVIDFLPAEYGSVIVAPRELIEISGADFDIDKLYALIKEWYIDKDKNGNLVVREYGKAESPKDKFTDFINYTLTKDKNFSKIFESLYPDSKDGLFINLEIFKSTGILKKEISTILKSLNLPTTVEEYAQKESALGVPLYLGALNNQILEAKSALLYNPETTSGDLPSAYQPADISPLTDLLAELKADIEELNPEIAQMLFDEKSYNTSGSLGKFFAFKSNKEGAVGIGPTVNSLLQWAFLAKGGKNNLTENFKAFKINGVSFDNYVNRNSVGGERKGFIFSTLITAMVDNAKERMADRLGLSIEALGVVSHLVATGVDLKDAVLLVNVAAVKEVFKVSADSKSLFGKRSSKRRIIEGLIGDYRKKLDPDFNLEQFSEKFSTEDLKKAIADPDNNPAAVINSLMLLNEQLEMTRYFSAISDVTKLVKGFSPDMESFNKIRESIDLLRSAKSPYGFDDYLATSELYSSIVNIYSDMEKMVKSVVLAESSALKSIKSFVNSVAQSKQSSKAKDFNKLLETSLLSFMTVKAYLKSSKLSPTLRAALNNHIIYNGGDVKDSVISALVSLRGAYPDNYFINNYLVAKPADKKGNKTGLDLIESNNWSKLNENQRNKIQLSLLELASDLKNRRHFDKLLAYLMVKDGFQFKSGSFLNIVPPVLFSSYFEATKELSKALRPNTLNSIESFYGEKLSDLTKEFLESFMESKAVSFFTPYIGANSSILKLDFVKYTDSKLIIDLLPKYEKVTSEEGELLYDENGNPVYTDVGEQFIMVDAKTSDEKMSEVQKKISLIADASEVFGRTTTASGEPGKQLIAPSHIKIGTKYYKLVKVKRFGTKNESVVELDEKGKIVDRIRGNRFEYVAFEPQGSKAQFPTGWKLFGSFVKPDQYNPIPKADLTNPGYSEKSAIPASAQVATPVTEPAKVNKPNDILLNEYGILAKFDFTTKGFTYTDVNTGETLENYSKNSPMEVLQKKMSEDVPFDIMGEIAPASTQPSTSVEITKSNYTRQEVQNNPDTAYVFTENTYSITAFPNRSGGGSAVIRPEPNAFAIVTKKKYDYNTRENVDYSDTEVDFKEFTEVNTRLINELKNSGKSKIKFPQGFATDKAKMPTRFAKWLQKALLDNFGLVTELNSTKTGLISKSTQPSTSVNPGVQQTSEVKTVIPQTSTLNSKLADYKSTLKSWFDSLSEEQRDLLVPLKFLLEDYEEYIKKNPSSTVQNFIELLKKNYCIN